MLNSETTVCPGALWKQILFRQTWLENAKMCSLIFNSEGVAEKWFNRTRWKVIVFWHRLSQETHPFWLIQRSHNILANAERSAGAQQSGQLQPCDQNWYLKKKTRLSKYNQQFVNKTTKRNNTFSIFACYADGFQKIILIMGHISILNINFKCLWKLNDDC